MNKTEIIGYAIALKGAGIIGTFAMIEGLRFFDGWPSVWIVWPLLILGFFMVLFGLGLAARAES
ncbi:MAG: hypothetical protein AAF558_07000 [Verrucomicrobiota bacterium]